jgi:hypothetical protein
MSSGIVLVMFEADIMHICAGNMPPKALMLAVRVI